MGYPRLGSLTWSVGRTIYSRDHQRLVAILRSLREQAGLTQVELATRLKRPQSFVSKYEAGQRRLDLVELKQIAEALGSSVVAVVRRWEKA